MSFNFLLKSKILIYNDIESLALSNFRYGYKFAHLKNGSEPFSKQFDFNYFKQYSKMTNIKNLLMNIFVAG